MIYRHVFESVTVFFSFLLSFVLSLSLSFFLSFFPGWRIPKFITRLSRWCTSDASLWIPSDMLQCVAARYSVWYTDSHTLQRTATHCNITVNTEWHADEILILCVDIPQSVHRTGICNTLQHTATRCNTLQHSLYIARCRGFLVSEVVEDPFHHCAYRVTCCSVLQCVVVCVIYRLIHTTTHCNTLQHLCEYRVTYTQDIILCVYISDKTLFFVSIYQATIYSFCLFIRQDFVLCVDIPQSV